LPLVADLGQQNKILKDQAKGVREILENIL